MGEQPRILVISVSSWNSKVGSNTWASLLKQYDSSHIANICIRDEMPDSAICSRYFTISENLILKSLINRKVKTGKEVLSSSNANENKNLEEHNRRYQKMQKKRRYSFLLLRELLWKLGKWKTAELDSFLLDFKPDIILHSMEGYIHLNRIVQYAIKKTGAKAVGYIWDDNFTYQQSSALGYKIYRFFQRISLKKLAEKTSAFFAISPMTKQEADAFFHIDCKVLTKPLSRKPDVDESEAQLPITAVYTGNLKIGRDRTLARIIKAARKVNQQHVKIQFDIYTQTVLDEECKQELNCKWCRLHEPIPQSEVLEIQRKADMLLFVEDMDGKDARVARLSFSTKITDYLSSGKCIFAVGCRDTAPMQYFIENEAALIADTDEQIEKVLTAVTTDPCLLKQYALQSSETGKKNHDEQKILHSFDDVLRSVL